MRDSWPRAQMSIAWYWVLAIPPGCGDSRRSCSTWTSRCSSRERCPKPRWWCSACRAGATRLSRRRRSNGRLMWCRCRGPSPTWSSCWHCTSEQRTLAGRSWSARDSRPGTAVCWRAMPQPSSTPSPRCTLRGWAPAVRPASVSCTVLGRAPLWTGGTGSGVAVGAARAGNSCGFPTRSVRMTVTGRRWRMRCCWCRRSTTLSG